MTNFAKFLSVNGLKRKDIASFLGVSGAFITQISSGDRPLPEEKLAMIKANAYGWDISMLTGPSNGIVLPTMEEDGKGLNLKSVIRGIVDPRSTHATLDLVIQHLIGEINDLKTEIDNLKAMSSKLKDERDDLLVSNHTLQNLLDLAKEGEAASPADAD